MGPVPTLMGALLAMSRSGALDAALECGNASFEDCVGGIADAGIDVALHIEIEKGGAVGGRIKFKRDGLVDGDRHGFGDGVAVVAGMNRKSFPFH